MLHGYCVRRAADPPPSSALLGVGGAHVTAMVRGPLAIWISERDGGEPATVERLREHDAVVTAALATATPLPLRYGSLFRTDADALSVLDSRREEFESALERVRDRVEFGLLVSRKEVPEPGAADVSTKVAERSTPGQVAPVITDGGPGTGREYLERRRKALDTTRSAIQHGEELLGEIDTEFGHLGLASAKTIFRTGQVVGTLAHLVHTAELRAYRDRVVEVRRRHTELQIVPSGPWAPYSFV